MTKRTAGGFLRDRRVGLFALAGAFGLLLWVPIHGHGFAPGAPEVLSNEDTGIIILPESVLADRQRVGQILRCSFLGWWAPTSCLPEIRATGLHLWFLTESGIEYRAIEPFPAQGEAYVYQGTLCWVLGRDAWEWQGEDFTKLSESEAALVVGQRPSSDDLIQEEGWTRHRIGDDRRLLPLGPYRVRYTRPAIDVGDTTELQIEEGPVVGSLYSRADGWRLSGLVDRTPKFSVGEPRLTER